MTVVINGTTGIDTGTGSLVAADSTTATYLDMFEDTDNGSNYVRLIAPASVASNKTITLPDETGTVITSGGSGVVSQSMLATAVVPLGVGQTWQQPSRSAGVTYTNSTGRPIMAVISCASGTVNGFVYLTIGSTIVSYANWSHNMGSISSGVTLVAIIPNGSTYFVTNSGFSISYWNELR